MDIKAKELAQALLNSGESSYTTTFNITEHDRRSDEVIVVVAIRTGDKGEKAVKRLTEAVKAVSGPSGIPCPMCNGSGRI